MSALLKNCRWFTLFVLLLQVTAICAQEGNAWKKGKLHWRHFTLVADDDQVFKANLSYIAEDMSDTIENLISIDFRIVIDHSQTWVKNGHLTRHLLNHEQTHFDLAELQLRKLKQQLAGQPGLLLKYDSLLQSVKAREDYIQKQFDRETAFGTDVEKNKEWYKRTRKALRQMRRYKPPLIIRLRDS